MCAGSLVQTYKLLVHALQIIRLRCDGGKHSMSNRKEGRKWRENTNQKAPDGFSRLEVFEKAATKKDDHNHPNSLQRVNYRNEHINISGNMVKPV